MSYNKKGSASRGQQSQATIHTHAQYLTGQRDASVGEHAAHVIRQRAQEQQRGDLVAMGHRDMPAWVGTDPLVYWKAADTHAPRANTHLAKELVLSLPRELSRADNQALIAQALRLVPGHHPLTWAFHCPKTRNGRDEQPHVHILVSPKMIGRPQDDAATFFLPVCDGGAANQMLWTTPPTLRTLHREWDTLLRSTLKAHNLEKTLVRPAHFKELPLTWQEMEHLRKFLQATRRGSWGHEYTIPAAQITAWQTQGQITVRQATWIAQRSQKQLTYQIEQLRPQVWESTAQLDHTSAWQVFTRARARKAQGRAEATIQTLVKQRYQAAQVYQQSLSPALAKATAQWREHKAAERAQRRGRQHGARRLLSEHTPGRGLQVQIEGLDEQQRQRQLALQRDRDRESRGW